jgi:hypothetical protein
VFAYTKGKPVWCSDLYEAGRVFNQVMKCGCELVVIDNKLKLIRCDAPTPRDERKDWRIR